MLKKNLLLPEDKSQILTEDQQLYQEICDLIADQEQSEHLRIHLILEKFSKDSRKFYGAIESNRHLNSSKIEYKNILQFLIFSVENDLFFVTKFLIDFLKFCLTEEQNFLNLIESNPYGLDPLLFVAARHDFKGETVKLLLNENVDVNLLYSISKINSQNIAVASLVTALSEAINAQNYEAFKLLVAHTGINLHLSIKFLYEEDLKPCSNLVEELLEIIDNVEKLIDGGSNFLNEIFFTYGYSDIFKILVNKRPGYINVKTTEGNNLLHNIILSQSSFQNIKYLIKSGIDVNAQNNQGCTPLHLLATMQSPTAGKKQILEAIIRYLLLSNARIGIKNNLGKLAFEIGSDHFREVVQSFYFSLEIKKIICSIYQNEGQKIESIKKKYYDNHQLFLKTFIMSDEILSEASLNLDLLEILNLSIEYNFFYLTKFFLILPQLFPNEKLAEDTLVFRRNITTSGPLWGDLCLIHVAAKQDISGSITNLLIDYGCDINSNRHLYTCLEIAIHFDQKNSVNAIINHKSFNPKFHLLRFFSKNSLSYKEFICFSELLLKIEDLEQTNALGETFLHEAVRVCRNDWAIEFLISKRRPNLIAKTFKTGLTPLHIALAEGTVKTAEILLRSGASPTILSAAEISVFDHMIAYQIINSGDSIENLDEILVKKLEVIGFKEKAKLLLANHEVIVSKNSLLVFDTYNKTQNCHKFWDSLISMLESARSELKQQKLVEALNNNQYSPYNYVNINCASGEKKDKTR